MILYASGVAAWQPPVDQAPAVVMPAKSQPYTPLYLLPVRAEEPRFAGTSAARAAGGGMTIAARKAALARIYGLAAVADGDVAWSADELDRVAEALASIPLADRAALADVEIRRVSAVEPPFAAEFSFQTGTVDPSNPHTARPLAFIMVGNAAFVDSNGQKTDRQEQVRLLVHEVGHAVAYRAQREADLADRRVFAALEASVAAANQAIDSLNVAINAFDAGVVDYSAQADAYNRAQADGLADALQIPREAELDSKQALIAVARQRVDALQAVVDARQHAATIAAARRQITLRAVNAAAPGAQAAPKTPPRLASRANLVQRFVNLVEIHHIPPVTPFAEQNWPYNPEEAFAEAYSVWRTHPGELSAEAKPLFDWFETGRYRN